MDIIWIGGAFSLGFLCSRIYLPPLVGYLLAGLLLSLTHYIPGEMLKELSHLGILFLLFTVGTHIRVKDIVRADVVGVGILHLALFSGIFFAIFTGFSVPFPVNLILAVSIGFSSTVLTAKSLEARNELGAFHARVSIGILIFQDIIAIGLLAYLGDNDPPIWAFSLLALPALRPVLLFIIRKIKDDELQLLLGLALALGGSWLFSALGLSGELGALAFGMLLAGDESSKQLEKKLWGVKEAFLVAFFLEIGLNGFPEASGYTFIGIALALLPLKLGLFFGLFVLFKLRARTALISALSLTAYSEFMLIVSAIGVSVGIISAEWLIILGLLAVISFGINAVLMRWEESIWQKIEPVLTRFERDVRHPDRKVISLGSAEYLVVGMGNAGIAAYKHMKKEGHAVVGMDIDPERIEKNRAKSRRVIYGDINDNEMWKSLDLTDIKAVMIAMGNLESKVNAAKLMRSCRFKGKILAITMRPDESDALKKAGAIPVSIPIDEAGLRLAQLSLTS